MAETKLYQNKMKLIDEIQFHVKDLQTVEHLLSYLSIEDYISNRALFSRSTVLLEKVRANLARFSRELKENIHE
jgi:hypothetical protein